ncbi:MAG TPA: serine/threonine-protein kinase [Ktedonobacteraceae bacterium]|nr:serine/threonine-protein kinase [Ktedonobacteraceae bacterium]
MSTASQRLGKYELRELLGRGGMAEVWKAFDTQLHRYVAIKILHTNLQTDPGFIARFAHEAQIVAALRHPNIVQIYDFHISEQPESDNTIAYMVMEYIEGNTLAHYIHETSEQQHFPPAADIVRLFTPISLALDYAHQQGTIHRDIKPANILLDHRHKTRNPMGEPILSDFGLAKLLTAPSQTLAGMVFGTPLYISPEQVQNQPISDRTDLYSLGIILYEIFTGVTPYRGDGVRTMLQHVTHEPPEPRLINPNLSPTVSAFLLKSIAKEPQNRFPSASAMTAALASALHLPIPEDLQEMLSLKNDSAMPVYENPSSNGSPDADVSWGTSYATQLTGSPVNGDNAPMQPVMEADSMGGTFALPDSETHLITSEKNDRGSAPESLFAKQTIPPLSNPKPEVRSSPPLRQQPPMTPMPPVFSPPAAPEHQKRRRLRIVLAAILVCVLLGAGLGTYFLYTTHHTSATITTSTVFGQAYFVSSGKVNQQAIPYGNDEFQIDLSNIPNPSPGKSYYAWLEPDNIHGDMDSLLLGRLPLNHGTIHFLYTGDNQHSNLLATYSRFLITEENATIMPSIPTPDLTAWRYYAALPQTPAPRETYSLLDHLRHLLSDDPDLVKLGLRGGLDTWAYRNTNRIQQWASSAQSDWHTQDFTSLHRFVVLILDYVDGSTMVQHDVPPGTPLVADPKFSQVGMLELNAGQNPPAYLYHIATHLNGVLTSPGSTTYQRNLAIQINTGINNVNGWLRQVRSDAIQLVKMDDAHLALSSSLALLNDMATQAHNAYMGRNGPSAGQVQQGMSQIYVNAQRLATFSVTAYK